MKIEDWPEEYQLRTVFQRLSEEDKDRWVTSAVMGLDVAAAELWNPTDCLDDASKVVNRIYSQDLEEPFAKALRGYADDQDALLAAYGGSSQTDTFSKLQVISMLNCRPETICLAALSAIAYKERSVKKVIEGFEPAAEVYRKPISGDSDQES